MRWRDKCTWAWAPAPKTRIVRGDSGASRCDARSEPEYDSYVDLWNRKERGEMRAPAAVLIAVKDFEFTIAFTAPEFSSITTVLAGIPRVSLVDVGTEASLSAVVSEERAGMMRVV